MSKVRLFVALELPGEVRAALHRWAREELGEREGVRVLAPDSLHVTLCFLGWVGEEDVDRVAALVTGAPAPSGALAVSGLALLPPRRPRVLAADLEDEGGALAQAQAALSSALSATGLYEPEARPWRPHVTVARVRPPARLRAEDLPAPPTKRFPADRISLFRSHLRRGGAQYEVIASASG